MTLAAVCILTGIAIGVFVGYIARDVLAITENARAYQQGRKDGFKLGEEAALRPITTALEAMEASWPRG